MGGCNLLLNPHLADFRHLSDLLKTDPTHPPTHPPTPSAWKACSPAVDGLEGL